MTDTNKSGTIDEAFFYLLLMHDARMHWEVRKAKGDDQNWPYPNYGKESEIMLKPQILTFTRAPQTQ